MSSRPGLGVLLAASMLLVACTGTGTPGTSTTSPSAATTTTAATTTAAPGSTSTTTAPAGTTTTTEPPQTGTDFDIDVAGGQVSGGGRLDVALGDEVTLRVTSDTADEVHLHGYDLSVDVVPGEPAELTFTADVPGIFEIELEQSGIELASLEVGA